MKRNVNKELKTVKVSDIIPYDNNPRRNDKAVAPTKASIEQVGYINPIIVDENMVILAGHTRLKSLLELGEDDVEVMVVSGLSEEKKKKYRLLDNKTNEFASWDWEKLDEELDGLDFEDFDFGFDTADFDWENVLDIKETGYTEPEHERLRCPLCGGVDYKMHFVKVNKAGEEE